MSNIPEHALYITPEQLRVGLYIHLDLHWMEHPFSFGSFRIKNQDQIKTIRELGLKRIRFEPERSDAQPLPPLPKPAAKEAPEPPPPPQVESAESRIKQQRLVELNRIRNQISEVEKKFQHANKTVKNINRNIHTKPEETRRDAEELIAQMVESMLTEGAVLMHALNGNIGEEAYFHSLNVTVLSLMLAKILKLTPEETMHLGMGAMFHDIGKMEIPSRVLLKTDPLTRAEQAFLEKHCEYGVDLARKIKLSRQATEIIMQHHEYVDGSGYPHKLGGGSITPLAEIVAIVNTYDNLCNPLNLADALTPHEALSQMFAFKRAKFNETALKSFIRCMGVYPPGSIVQLSNDMLGLVMMLNPEKPLKPTVLVYDPDIPKEEAVIIDLDKEPDLSISKGLRPGQLPRGVYQYLNPRKHVTYYFDPQKPGEKP